MTSNNTGAFFLSTLLHAVIAGLVLFFTYAVNEQTKEPPKVLELVAGEGDNYMATEAPALGVPNAPKVAMPNIPTPPPGPRTPEPPAPDPEPVRAAPPEPVRPEPEPVIERAPAEKERPKPQPDAIRDFSKDVKRIASKREKRLEQKYRKEREAAEPKAKEEELRSRRMTKEEFDRQNKSAAKGGGGGGARSSTKVARIDTEGIVGGVVGGSTRNKTGGAGGKALTREEGEALDAYFSLLKRRLHEALDKPPGLADTLVAEVEFYLGADGSLSRGRITSSSGSQEFDQAALEAIAHVRSIGPRPDHKGEAVRIKFRMREEDE